MQGRLLPPVNNSIQAFPEKEWQKEFPLARALGLDCIEFIFDGDNHSRHPLMMEESLRKIQDLEHEHDIRILSVCADYFMTHPFHLGSRNEKRSNVQVLQRLIQNCASLEVENIIIPCVDNSRLRNIDDLTELKLNLGDCLNCAEDYSINLALETDLEPDVFIGLVKDFNSEYLKINYDMGNSASLGYNPAVEFECYGNCIMDVHIKDRVFGGTTVPLGEGDVDFSKVFSLLYRMNYNGLFILQTARKRSGMEQETIKGDLDFITKYLQ
jgi:L-ribulose-5-phosphate 3-epimerase